MQRTKPVTVVVVGAGHRSEWYGKYSIDHPDEMQVVGVADPNPIRRREFQKLFHFPDENMFEDADALAKKGKIADAVINGTMDEMHVSTTIPLMRAGYDILLEKPFALTEEEMWELYGVMLETGRRVMICHVLRYAPFYQAVKEEILKGTLGKILSIQASEYVSYHHMSIAYVRGKWNSLKKCKSGMLLAKSCHDMDIIMWLMNKTPVSISSFGSLMYFTPENAPEGAGERCMADCPHVDTCVYSAKRLYIDHPDRWRFYVWTEFEGKENVTIEDKIRLMKEESPFGRCIFKCDNDVVDHQSAIIQFEDGATASMNMISNSGKDERTLHIVGSKAEIYGSFEDGFFTIRAIDPSPGIECTAKIVDPLSGKKAEGHGGGDHRLVQDFIRYVRGQETTPSLTSLSDSIYGHQAVFLAEKSRETGQTQTFKAI
ncbi:MAG: Gfo/Idh/MocA family oxidoreductase [Clostridia bacterium]|nr:Gfo/Idh/MocA family oxidoreductase [Clostridia bacterium]